MRMKSEVMADWQAAGLKRMARLEVQIERMEKMLGRWRA